MKVCKVKAAIIAHESDEMENSHCRHLIEVEMGKRNKGNEGEVLQCCAREIEKSLYDFCVKLGNI